MLEPSISVGLNIAHLSAKKIETLTSVAIAIIALVVVSEAWMPTPNELGITVIGLSFGRLCFGIIAYGLAKKIGGDLGEEQEGETPFRVVYLILTVIEVTLGILACTGTLSTEQLALGMIGTSCFTMILMSLGCCCCCCMGCALIMGAGVRKEEVDQD